MPEGKLPRARRVGPAAPELDAPTLDGILTPPRRRHDGTMPARRRGRRGPAGADPLATTGLVFGVVSVVAGCVWPVTLGAGAVALGCGVAALGGRSRPRAIAAAVLGAVGLAAGVGVAASSVAILAAKAAPAAPPPPVRRGPVPFLP